MRIAKMWLAIVSLGLGLGLTVSWTSAQDLSCQEINDRWGKYTRLEMNYETSLENWKDKIEYLQYRLTDLKFGDFTMSGWINHCLHLLSEDKLDEKTSKTCEAVWKMHSEATKRQIEAKRQLLWLERQLYDLKLRKSQLSAMYVRKNCQNLPVGGGECTTGQKCFAVYQFKTRGTEQWQVGGSNRTRAAWVETIWDCYFPTQAKGLSRSQVEAGCRQLAREGARVNEQMESGNFTVTCLWGSKVTKFDCASEKPKFTNPVMKGAGICQQVSKRWLDWCQ